jgi:hypothetical protein
MRINLSPPDGDEAAEARKVIGESIGFRPEELFGCSACGRANGPSRLKCLYCGAELEPIADSADIKLNFRTLEDWESGWNIVTAAAPENNPAKAAGAARLLSVESAFLEEVFENGIPLPVARLDTEQGAATLRQRLEQLGVESIIISDADLKVASPPVRLRGLDFRTGRVAMIPFNGGPAVEVPTDRLALLVQGTLVKNRTESVEKRKRKQTKDVSEVISVSDEAVIDLYSRDEPTGWRVQFGFDFTCLGDERSMYAGENMRSLCRRLTAIAPEIRVVDRYDACRSLLDDVWPPRSTRESFGQRRGLGGTESKKVTVTDNSPQFTKFSRLQRHLL